MKKNMILLSSIGLLLISRAADAQVVDTTMATKEIAYPAYIGLVGKNNLAYSAEKFNVSLAEANLLSAGVFPDPTLNVGWSDAGQRRMHMGYGFSSELGWTWELGGKRKARMDVAKNEIEITRLLLQDYFRNLRADATLAYLKAIQNHLLLTVQSNSYLQMKKLAESDSIRFKLGSITQVDARQSQLEAGSMLNDVYAAVAEWKTSLNNLSLLLGDKQQDSLWHPIGDLTGFERSFSMQELIVTAQNNRADLKAALQNKSLSSGTLKLAKANRALDLGLSLGMDYGSYVDNTIAPTPSSTTVKAGISIPLKFSNNRPGELRAAQYGILKAEQEYKQTELAIQTEVTQAYFAYFSAQKQVRQFNTGLLQESKAILDAKIYSYQRGETSLLEVLNAQRTYNDVQQSYYKTLYGYAETLVELERAAGIWDIDF